MKQTQTYYDLLKVSPHADLAEISAAYMKLAQEMAAGDGPADAAELAFRQQLLKHAYEVLSSPSRRSDYDAGLASKGLPLATAELPMHIEVALESKKWSPIRRLLTIIAALMVFGMVMQISTMFMAYNRASSAYGNVDPASPAAEKVYLQEFYQTYGIRAASKAEADLLLADMKRKEQAERAEAEQKRLQERQEYEQRRFEEESRRLGAEVSANLQRAEQEAARAREEEIRRKEEAERAAKEAELARRQREIERFRGRGVSPSSDE
ncbi:MAG: Heat shock protein DnaJ, N-terminal [Proteobacteria bacterium]|nr:Heat shock protein DnaJ, N-terminal [Pseudomonadota bacterium]